MTADYDRTPTSHDPPSPDEKALRLKEGMEEKEVID
jgi:hypothetical protein